MKNNISYYSHYTNSDQHAKFKMLRAEFGWAGEGKFWALNNRIAQAENCCLDISKKYNKAAIASDLDFSLIEFDEYITFLIEDCELVKECKTNVITTDNVQEIHIKMVDERAKARERSERRWKKSEGTLSKFGRTSGEKDIVSTEKDIVSPKSDARVKESKVKERKGKNKLVLRGNNSNFTNKDFRSIISYLNKKVGTNFKYKTKSTQGFINARHNEGATKENFFTVIDKKTAEWLTDEKMCRYLRPETLFGSKFEGYLQEKKVIPKHKQFANQVPEETRRDPKSYDQNELIV